MRTAAHYVLFSSKHVVFAICLFERLCSVMKKYEHPSIEVVVFDNDIMAGIGISSADDVVTDIVGTEDGGEY